MRRRRCSVCKERMHRVCLDGYGERYACVCGEIWPSLRKKIRGKLSKDLWREEEGEGVNASEKGIAVVDIDAFRRMEHKSKQLFYESLRQQRVDDVQNAIVAERQKLLFYMQKHDVGRVNSKQQGVNMGRPFLIGYTVYATHTDCDDCAKIKMYAYAMASLLGKLRASRIEKKKRTTMKLCRYCGGTFSSTAARYYHIKKFHSKEQWGGDGE